MQTPAKAEGDRVHLQLASSNEGKLREYQELAALTSNGVAICLSLLPNFSQFPQFDETAPTFAENAVGKALHYSRYTDLPVLADDSGLMVDALGGAPGVYSARYAGPNATDAERTAKLLAELCAVEHRQGGPRNRAAQFVCVIAIARRGHVKAVISDAATGEILDAPRGANGFGYDPIFFVAALSRTFAEAGANEKNIYSHRGKAFRKAAAFLASSPVL